MWLRTGRIVAWCVRRDGCAQVGTTAVDVSRDHTPAEAILWVVGRRDAIRARLELDVHCTLTYRKHAETVSTVAWGRQSAVNVCLVSF